MIVRKVTLVLGDRCTYRQGTLRQYVKRDFGGEDYEDNVQEIMPRRDCVRSRKIRLVSGAALQY